MILIFSFLIIFLIVLLSIINIYVYLSVKDQIIDDYNDINNIDAIIVLGGGVRNDRPSPLLKDRLDKAIELYKMGISNRIIMSGDHGRKKYNEVSVMKKYAIENGVLSEDIFMDHAGFSTYDTIYRARDIFKVKRAIIVTQKYHLFRSLYIANKLGLDAYGVSASNTKYNDRFFREIREVLARNKDVIKCIFKPKPTYLGDVVPLSGSGDVTNDENF